MRRMARRISPMARLTALAILRFVAMLIPCECGLHGRDVHVPDRRGCVAAAGRCVLRAGAVGKRAYKLWGVVRRRSVPVPRYTLAGKRGARSDAPRVVLSTSSSGLRMIPSRPTSLPAQELRTSIFRGRSSARFGIRIVSTPSLRFASILAVSSSLPSTKLRRYSVERISA